jgi:hypothetical protein
MGSVVGGSATITTAWITQRTQSWRDVPKAELGNGRASRIRLTSSAPVVEAAEQTVRTILAQYFAPNLTTDQLKEAALSRTADPVKPFSEACRQELADLRRRTG